MARATDADDEIETATVTADAFDGLSVGTEIRWNGRRERATVVRVHRPGEDSVLNTATVRVETVRGAFYRLSAPLSADGDEPEVARRTARSYTGSDEYADSEALDSVEIVADGADVEPPVEVGDAWTSGPIEDLDDDEATHYEVLAVDAESMTVTVEPSSDYLVEAIELDYVDVSERVERAGGLDDEAPQETEDADEAGVEELAEEDEILVADGGRDADEIVDAIVDAGPEGARTIIPRAQAEALVYRDLLDYSRKETADVLDISVYTVDDRLSRARENSEAVAAVARVLLDLDVLDADDFSLDVDVETEPEPQSPEEPAPEDATPGGWDRLMGLDEVRQVTTMRSDDGVATIKLDGADDEETRAEVDAALEGVGLTPVAIEDHSGSVELVRARRLDEDVDEETEEIADVDDGPISREVLMIAQSVVVADTTDVPVEIREELPEVVDEALDLDGVSNGTVLGDVEIEGDEFDFSPASDLVGDEDEEASETDEDAAQSDAEDEPEGEAVEAEEAGEEDVGAEDVETLPGIGPKKAEALRANGFETVRDVAEGNPSRGMVEKGVLGGKVLVTAWDEARRRLGMSDEAIGVDEEASETDEDAAQSDAEDEPEEEDVDDEDADEGHSCPNCGETYPSPQALGGHVRTCDAGDEE